LIDLDVDLYLRVCVPLLRLYSMPKRPRTASRFDAKAATAREGRCACARGVVQAKECALPEGASSGASAELGAATTAEVSFVRYFALQIGIAMLVPGM
jgi:hypothetical protein